MVAIPQEVQEMFNKVPEVVFITADKYAQPNGCIVAMKKIVDDQTIFLSDQFFKKTLANIQQNQKVAVLFWEGSEAYEIHGTVRYSQDADWEAQASWVNAAFEQMGMPMRSKGGAFVTVDAVYSSTPGPQAGAQLV